MVRRSQPPWHRALVLIRRVLLALEFFGGCLAVAEAQTLSVMDAQPLVGLAIIKTLLCTRDSGRASQEKTWSRRLDRPTGMCYAVTLINRYPPPRSCHGWLFKCSKPCYLVLLWFVLWLFSHEDSHGRVSRVDVNVRQQLGDSVIGNIVATSKLADGK